MVGLFESASGADRLEFLGSIVGAAVGAALAILGAIRLEDWKRKRDTNVYRRMMADALRELLSSLIPLTENVQVDADEFDASAFKRRGINLLRDVNDAIALLDLANQRSQLSDFQELRALQAVRRELQAQATVFEREQQVVGRHAPTRTIAQVFYNKVKPAAEALIQEIEQAIALLER